ncbi:MAG: cellulase family glycosylhydrolase [Pirellulales bacterium]|nr:cellulase family glycosylhydrolase [Pirellulales bacterium]
MRTQHDQLAALVNAAFAVALLLVPPAASRAADAPPTPAGLEVRDGVLVREGKPYRGIGVNYFSAFGRALANPADTSYRAGFATLREYGIPFARFAACGFWPSDWRLYQDDPANYFARLDDVVKAAEDNQVGLIPSLFWRVETLPELVGEPASAWGDPASRTHALMRRYTEQIVARYRNSPAIWGWEFANEMSLAVDLPNAKSQLAARKAIPHLGVPAPTEADILHAPAMLTALREFGKTVRRLDPRRIVISGNSAPRASAWHNTAESSWTVDTREQFIEVLRRDNPDPLSVLCVHWYPEKDPRFSKTQPAASADVFRAMQEAARAARKPLFVGEFGVSKELGPAKEKTEFAAMLADLEQAGVPLAAVWVFDLTMQDKDWNITAANQRAYMLEAVSEANRRWQQAAGR